LAREVSEYLDMIGSDSQLRDVERSPGFTEATLFWLSINSDEILLHLWPFLQIKKEKRIS